MTHDNDIDVYQPAELATRTAPTDDWYDPFAKIVKLAEYIQSTEFVPESLRNRAPAIAAVILTGREIGLPPMVSLRHIFIVRGRPGQSAELMRAKIYQAGHELKVIEATDTRAILEGRRSNEEDWTRVQFTIEDARKNSVDIRAWAADKLIARATSRLARRKFADVIMGLPTIDELEDGATPADVVELAPAGPAIKRARAPRKQAAAVNTQPAPAPAETPAEPEGVDEWADEAEQAEHAADAQAAEAEQAEPGAIKPVTPAPKRPTPARPREVPKPEPEPEPPTPPAEPPTPAPKRRRGRPTKAEAEEIARERAEIAAARDRAKAAAAARNQPPPASAPVAAPLEEATATHIGLDGETHAGPAAETCPMCAEDEAELARFAEAERAARPPDQFDPPGPTGEQAGFNGIPAPPLSPEQRTKLIMTAREVGIISHEDRIILVGEIIGRPLDTTNDLDRDEATRVIDTLERWQTEGPARCNAHITDALNAWAARQIEAEQPPSS